MRLSRGARTLTGAALLVAVITAVARVTGFGRVLVFAQTVGPGCLGDAYYTANTIPNILFDLAVGGALTSIVVPVLAGPVEDGDRLRADRLLSALLSWTVLLTVPLMLAGMVLAHPIVSLLVGGGHPGCPTGTTVATGARMLVVFMPQVLLYGVSVVCIGALQAHRRFLAPALAPLLSSLVVAATYGLFGALAQPGEPGLRGLTRGHELVLSVGTTLGVVALMVTMLPALQRTGRKVRPTLHFPPGSGVLIRRLALAGAVVVGSQDVATAVILRLGNDAGAPGTVVLYTLGWTVFLLPWAVLAVPIGTTAFPVLSARFQGGDLRGYADTAARTTRAVLLAMAGAAALLVAVAAPLARIAVLGSPGTAAPIDLAHTLMAFAAGLPGYGLLAHLSRTHYARGAAGWPALATAIGWAVALATDVTLVAALPRADAAVAFGAGNAVGMTVAAALLLGSQRRMPRSLRGLAATARAALLAALVAGAAGATLAGVLPAGSIPASLVAGAVVTALAGAIFVGVVTVLDRPTLLLVLRAGRAGD